MALGSRIVRPLASQPQPRLACRAPDGQAARVDTAGQVPGAVGYGFWWCRARNAVRPRQAASALPAALLQACDRSAGYDDRGNPNTRRRQSEYLVEELAADRLAAALGESPAASRKI